ncbi:M23 family metallopeptidase [Georgenia sp. AZ-5]|uniref:M23 family metallopeptidase n=1 Tax=Georgenia sp. AZ-5 TaxID=3367526 RepID=UPI003754E081
MALLGSRLPLVAGLAAAGALSLGVLAAAPGPLPGGGTAVDGAAAAAGPEASGGGAGAAPANGARAVASNEGAAGGTSGARAGEVAASTVAAPEYSWPTGAPAEVVRAFDPPGRPWDAGHRGVDVAHPVGAPVLAAAGGVVVFAGTVVDRPVVSVQHEDGVRTTYEPVVPAVVAGQRVAAGDVLGHLGAGHCPPWKPGCLHWGARTGRDAYLDPLSLVGAEVVVRLLPDDVGLP